VLDDEPCCGHHSRRQGEEAQFQELAGRTLAALREHGVQRIVTPCPHCLHTLRRDDSGETIPVEVLHHSELLARLIESGDLRLDPQAAPTVAVYHDPCYLARFEATSDAPRAVLAAAGIDVRELPHRRERTLCCGGGAAGFVREQRVDRPRRAEITASGATLLVTACPECRTMLDATLDRTWDIAEAVARSIRRPAALRCAGGDGGIMTTPCAGIADLEARMLKMFTLHPAEDLQLLEIAGKSHVSGRLSDLKHAADALVEVGALELVHRSGARYYHLAAGAFEEDAAVS
jgi:Fe-S oxidoreductase